MPSGLTSRQQRDHMETGPRFKVSSERPEKRGIDLAIPGFVVWRVIHYNTAVINRESLTPGFAKPGVSDSLFIATVLTTPCS